MVNLPLIVIYCKYDNIGEYKLVSHIFVAEDSILYHVHAHLGDKREQDLYFIDAF